MERLLEGESGLLVVGLEIDWSNTFGLLIAAVLSAVGDQRIYHQPD